jgi:uncharacterized protein DUF732
VRCTAADSWPRASRRQQHRAGVGDAVGDSGGDFDGALVDALKRHDILAVGDPAEVVTWAHWACDQLRQGAPKEHVVAWLSQYQPNADNSVFLREAALYYCQELKSKAGW